MKLAISIAVGISTLITLSVLNGILATWLFGSGEEANVFAFIVGMLLGAMSFFVGQAFYEMFE